MAITGTLFSLDVPTAVEAGDAVPVKHLMPEKSIQFTGFTSGTFLAVATMYVQGSNDNTNWSNLSAAITSDGFVFVETPVEFIRINVTAHTSGTAQTAVLCGYGAGYQP
jgi:hypothetical protein